jgi:hypothetical protein
MPKDKAKVLAGYSGKTSTDQLKIGGDVALTVDAIRTRLQETAGVTLADQVAWYVRARGEPEGASTDQISASKQIDKLLGFEAAQKVEMNSNHRHEIVAAVAVFRDFTRETGLNPRQLKVALANHRNRVALASEPVEANVVQMVSRETLEAAE